jgi:PiT family inorganic phosphate transporter
MVSLLFVNGFTDAPSTVAGLVSTRTLTPARAVLLAAFFNLCGTVAMAYISSDVAETVSGIVRFGEDGKHALRILSAGICAVVVWSLAAWRLGIPTSGSHALVSALPEPRSRAGWDFGINAQGGGIFVGLLVSTLPSYLLAKTDFHRICLLLLKTLTGGGL